MAKKIKGDNNGDISSDKNRAHKTHTFERELDILKCIDNGEGHGEIARSLGLSRSTVSTIAKNRVKIMEHVKSAGSLKSIMVNPKRSVVTEEMEHLLKILAG
jgi:transcriptional regulator